jgi:hypothetical protein
MTNSKRSQPPQANSNKSQKRKLDSNSSSSKEDEQQQHGSTSHDTILSYEVVPTTAFQHQPPLPSGVVLERGDNFQECNANEVLRLLSRTGFLPIKDLGRLLLLTSKSLTSSLFNQDEVWSLLMQKRFSFPSPAALLLNNTNTLPFSNKEIFLAMSKERNATKEAMVIRAPKYLPRDYIIFINLFRGKGGQALISRCLEGASIPSFFEDGRIEVYDCDLKFSDGELDGLDLNITVHIYRLVDHKVLLFFRGRCEDPDVDGAWFPSEDGTLEMRDYNYARFLNKEITDLYEFLSGLKVDIFVSTNSENESCMEYGTIEVATELIFDDDFEPFPTGKPVTFAHYLEEIYGWT